MGGGALSGARVFYGGAVFVTVSPRRRHSCLAVRLSSVRANDPLLLHEQMLLSEAQQLVSGTYSILDVGGEVLVDIPD